MSDAFDPFGALVDGFTSRPELEHSFQGGHPAPPTQSLAMPAAPAALVSPGRTMQEAGMSTLASATSVWPMPGGWHKRRTATPAAIETLNAHLSSISPNELITTRDKYRALARFAKNQPDAGAYPDPALRELAGITRASAHLVLKEFEFSGELDQPADIMAAQLHLHQHGLWYETSKKAKLRELLRTVRLADGPGWSNKHIREAADHASSALLNEVLDEPECSRPAGPVFVRAGKADEG